ncbi:MAG TPA: hypothetical protein DCW29_10660 [Janthinobacterium sp.]|nr:hypothetical protein [Janthinobacterium sp.]
MNFFAIAALSFLIYFVVKAFRGRRQAGNGVAHALSPWMEIVSEELQFMAGGHRLAWLPAKEFGSGSCVLVGVVDLENLVPALRAAIDRLCHPVYLDEHRVLSRMVARPGLGENLVISALDDAALQARIEAALPKNLEDIDVMIEMTSSNVGLCQNEDSRQEFSQIWRQYAPVFQSESGSVTA